MAYKSGKITLQSFFFSVGKYVLQITGETSADKQPQTRCLDCLQDFEKNIWDSVQVACYLCLAKQTERRWLNLELLPRNR